MATAPTRRRLAPDVRRDQILDAARGLFAERPYTSWSTGDVAEAAGVARSLVHHYFGGIRDVFLAVVARGGAALSDVRTAGPETPLEERLTRNVAAGLDVVAAHRETWLAVVARGGATADPEIQGLMRALAERSVERMLQVNRDVVRDTPAARLALRSFNALATDATCAWLEGDAPREQVQTLLVTACRDLLTRTIPRLEDQAT